MGSSRNCPVCGRWAGTSGRHACAPKVTPPTTGNKPATAYLTGTDMEEAVNIAGLYENFRETQADRDAPLDLINEQMRAIDPSLDDAQRASIAEQVTRRYDRYTESRLPAPTQEQWDEFVRQQAAAIDANDRLDEATRSSLAGQWRALEGTEPPGAKTYNYLVTYPKRIRRARWALQEQASSIGAWRGVSEMDTTVAYRIAREDYLENAESNPDAYEVPEGYTKAFRRTANGSPVDPATVYGFYRAEQAHYTVPPAAPRTYVAVDLETTGIAAGSDIIEIGTVTYDEHGNEISRWSTLIKPTPNEDGVLDTGPVNVHGITSDDVKDAPTFDQVVGDIRDHLDGAIIIGHNLKFDTMHLRMSMDRHPLPEPAEGEPRPPKYPWAAEADTMVHAVRHVPGLSDYKLVTVSGHVGVAYTNGHRAEHDAAVAGETFFKLREPLKARTTYDDPWAVN